MTEYIDGPVEEAVPEQGIDVYIELIASSPGYAEVLAGAGIYADIENITPLRLTSWVEQSDSRFGYALLFAPPEVTGEEAAFSQVEARLLTIDREQHTLTGESKTFRIPITPDDKRILAFCDDLSGRFSEDEAALVLAMMRKSGAAFLAGQAIMLDGDVRLTLVEQNLDQLAEMYGNPQSEEEEPVGPQFSQILTDPEVLEAAATAVARHAVNGYLSLKLGVGEKEYLLDAPDEDEFDRVKGFKVLRVTISEGEEFIESYKLARQPNAIGDEAQDDPVDPAILDKTTLLKILIGGGRPAD